MRGGGMGNLMRQAQQMQANLAKAQTELATMTVTGEAGSGAIKVAMNGKHEVSRISIDPSLALDDRELLEDLVTAAVNDAVRKIDQISQQRLSGLMGGMNLPPGFKMPF